MKPFLIQRARFAHRPHKKGIDKLLQFAYMGSSEFEWGALPNSLKRVREKLKKYVAFDYTFELNPNKTVTVFCLPEHEEVLQTKILEELAQGTIRGKEFIDITDFVKDNKNHSTNDFWWDIDHNWFCWAKNDEFKNNFLRELKKGVA